jgi:tetratricopeptide (TPR) repeat protein
LSEEDSAKIDEIQLQLYQGHYKEAMLSLDEAIKDKRKPPEFCIQYMILKSKLLIKLGQYDECLSLVNEVLKKIIQEWDIYCKIDFLLQKAEALEQLADFDEELKVINKIEELISEVEIQPDKIDNWLGQLHKLKGWYNVNKTNFDEAYDHLKLSQEIFERINDKENMAQVIVLLGSLHLRRGERDKGLSHYQKNLKIREEIGNQEDIALALRYIGVYYSFIRDFTEALSYYDRSLPVLERSENKRHQGNLYNSLGLTYYHLGDINKASEFYELALFYLQQVGSKLQIAYLLSNIGSVEQLRGNLSKALEAHLQCLKIFDEVNSIQNIGAQLLYIGRTYMRMGEHKKALSFLNQALEYRRKTRNNSFIANGLYALISYYTFTNNLEEAKKHFLELQQINKLEVDPLIEQRTKIAEALILKLDNRSKSRVRAEELLEQVIDMELIDFNMYLEAMLNLCELFVIEIKLTGNKEVLKEIRVLLEKLFVIAMQQQSFWVLAQVHWIQAHLALIDWDINKAQKSLTEAQIIAEEKGFSHLAKRISQEFDKTLDQMDLWEQLRENNASIIERIEVTQLDDLLGKLKQQIFNLDDLPAEQPVMLLILTQTGLPIFNKNFVPSKFSKDESLLSGFISSINTFFKEVFETSGSIERIKHHDLTVLLKPVESVLFCYVFKGQSYSAIKKLEEFVLQLQEKRKDAWSALLEQIETTVPLEKRIARILEKDISKIFEKAN